MASYSQFGYGYPSASQVCKDTVYAILQTVVNISFILFLFSTSNWYKCYKQIALENLKCKSATRKWKTKLQTI